MTFTCAVHVPGLPCEIVPPEKESVVSPAEGAHVAPVQVVDAAGTDATFIPEGRISVNETDVRSLEEFGFVRVNVRVEVAPTLIGSSENDLDNCGFSRFVVAHPLIRILSTLR